MNQTADKVLLWSLVGRDTATGEELVRVDNTEALPVNALCSDSKWISDLQWEYFTTITPKEDLKLHCPALSPLCHVYIDDQCVGQADSAFYPHTFSVQKSQTDAQKLKIVFASVTDFLKQRRARPAWKTAIANNHMRWLRTPLIGAISAWANEGSAVGLLQPPTLINANDIQLHCRPYWSDGQAQVELTCSEPIERLHLEINRNSVPVTLNEPAFRVKVPLGELDTWWPHTHGAPVRHTLEIKLQSQSSEQTFSRQVAFKKVSLSDVDSPLIEINDTPIFFRGACWTASNYPTALYDAHRARSILTHARDLGFNGIRIAGPMPYEHSDFYSLCDELGLMVWQDFCFANFYYPTDEGFLDLVAKEVHQQLLRLSEFGCLTVLCGNSEVEQQGSMMGQSTEQLNHPIFHELIPEQVQRLSPSLPYVPSSPSGGDWPFQTNQGFSHYFGYGAYRQPASDLQRADVRFASECLGLSHVPSESFCQQHFSARNPAPHRPNWKAGINSDAGTGWDFEDIRDYYLAHYFKVDPIELRYRDLERYHRFSRIVTGYMMRKAFTFWRADSSNCSGAISWWLNDIKPGAGWGLIDSDGQIKPAAQVLKPQLQPLHIGLIDEGLNGHRISLVNETDRWVDGTLKGFLIHSARNTTDTAELPIRLAPKSQCSLTMNRLFNRFIDSTDLYCFGPRAFDAVAVVLHSDDQHHCDVDYPSGLDLPVQEDPSVFHADATRIHQEDDSIIEIVVNRLISFAEITVKNGSLDNNLQTLLPGVPFRFKTDIPATDPIQLTLSGLNIAFRHRITLDPVA